MSKRLLQCLILVCVTLGLAGLGWSQARNTDAASAQTGTVAVNAIQYVKLGMPRSAVLAGLAKNYDLSKISNEPDDSGTWLVYGKDPAKFEQAEIFFL